MDLGAANTRNYDRTGTEVNFGPISGGSIFIKKFQDQPVQLQYTESLGTELERDIWRFFAVLIRDRSDWE